jgi:hypothetical protein
LPRNDGYFASPAMVAASSRWPVRISTPCLAARRRRRPRRSRCAPAPPCAPPT